MKHSILFFCMLILVVIVPKKLSAQIPPYVSTIGMLGWWPFNGTMMDESPNNNDLTSFGGTTYTLDRFGNMNQAALLDGVNDFMKSTNPFFDASNNHTVSLWFKSYSATQQRQTFYNTIPHRILSIGFNWYTGTYDMGLGNGSIWNIITTTSVGLDTFGVASGNVTQWNHYVVRKTGFVWEIFLNGGLVHTYTAPSNPLGGLTDLWFGSISFFGYANQLFNGKLDDIGMWNRALTNSEIANLYNGNNSQFTNIDVNLCQGQSYLLSNGIALSLPGIYYDTLINGIGQDSIIQINLLIHNSYNTTVFASICSGQTYTLPNGSNSNVAGTFIDSFITLNGCDSIIYTILSVNPSSYQSLESHICYGQTYTLPNGSIANTTGVYTNTFLNQYNCDSVISINLVVQPLLNIIENKAICNGDYYILPSGIQVSSSGTYLSKFLSVDGCDSNFVTILIVDDNIKISQTITICSDQTYTLPNSAIVSWSGIYYDTLKSGFGCDSIIETFLNVVEKPNLFLGNDTTLCPDDNLTLDISTPNATYWWNDSTNHPFKVITDPGLYIAQIILPPCDLVSDTLNITGCENCNVFIPNAFTPNKDNTNDLFRPIFSCPVQGGNYSMKIFNRWGSQIFYSTSINKGWDGTNSDIEQSIGTYFYLIRYIHPITKRENILKGDIVLIR